jgi:Homoserine acetyltransferase
MLRSLCQSSRPFLAHQRGVPSIFTGGGNRVFTNGSGIGSDSSMIAANDRLIPLLLDSFVSSTRALSTMIQRCGSSSVAMQPKNSTMIKDMALRSLSSSDTAAGDDRGGMDDEYGEMTADGNTYVHPVPFVLENGDEIQDVQLRYMTYGTLNEKKDNVLVVCHALTGNASLHSWWGDLLGPGLAFDTEKYFIVCSNILGSCYGSTGPASLRMVPSVGRSMAYTSLM